MEIIRMILPAWNKNPEAFSQTVNNMFFQSGVLYVGNSKIRNVERTLLMTLLSSQADPRAPIMPNKYITKSAMPCKLNPKKYCSGITNPISTTYIGKRAEQVINGVTRIVSRRSLGFSIFRADITAGMAHAAPDIKGMTDLPFKPKGRSQRSIRNTTRLMSPDSSINDKKRKSTTICGKKITIPPIPATIPSVNKADHGP